MRNQEKDLSRRVVESDLLTLEIVLAVDRKKAGTGCRLEGIIDIIDWRRG